jgi:hypothetical protein
LCNKALIFFRNFSTKKKEEILNFFSAVYTFKISVGGKLPKMKKLFHFGKIYTVSRQTQPLKVIRFLFFSQQTVSAFGCSLAKLQVICLVVKLTSINLH